MKNKEAKDKKAGSKKIVKYENTKATKKVNKVRIFIAIVVVIIVAFYLGYAVFVFFKNPTDTFIVKDGEITQEETVAGYIIRDETVIIGENYKNGMVQIKGEGEKVAKGDPIFRYYASGEETLKEKIAELDEQIQEAMEANNDDLTSQDIKQLNTQIEEKIQQITQTNDVQKILEYKSDIAGYITKKAKIAGELSPSGSYLKKLIDERSTYENQLNSGAEYITATRSGLVSYKVDGLEEVLTTSDFSNINKEFLTSLNLKTGQIVATSTESGKIVNNFIAYIACISKTDEANSAEIGDTVKIVLPSSKEVDATIEYITKESNNEVTIIFSITEGIDELLNYRKVSVDIVWWDESGYKVSNSSIIREDNLCYVIRVEAGYQEKVLVKVKKEGENYTIVTNYSTSEINELEIADDVYTSLVLYDEILLYPNTE